MLARTVSALCGARVGTGDGVLGCGRACDMGHDRPVNPTATSLGCLQLLGFEGNPLGSSGPAPGSNDRGGKPPGCLSSSTAARAA